MNKIAVISLLSMTFRLAAPLLLTALGAIFSERSGVVNIALEGIMTIGAFFALAATYATGSAWIGVFAAILSGMIIAALHAVVSIKFEANQVVSGVAINILGAGLTAFLLNVFYGHGGQSPAIDASSQIPKAFEFLEAVPVIGPIIGGHNILVYFAFVMVPITSFILFKTKLGLRLRAVGEHPRAADTLGVNVHMMRYLGVIVSGALGGLAGAMLSIGEGTVFLEGMIAGRGFISCYDFWKLETCWYNACMFIIWIYIRFTNCLTSSRNCRHSITSTSYFTIRINYFSISWICR
jgi:simple sugar transport system permease protein